MIGPPDRYLLLLGSNVDREGSMARAAERLGREFEVLARSRVVESAAVGHPADPPFHNRALLVRSALPAGEMRRALRALEDGLGRVRAADRNAPRTIDIDLLLVLDAAGAVLPDPPVQRDLVRHHYAAVPAAEIAGDLRLPGGRTLAEVAAALGPPPAGFRILDPA